MVTAPALNREIFLEQLALSHCSSHSLTNRNYKESEFTNYVVSCSGGLDSMVLLHLMQSIKYTLLSKGISISAIYVNHNLSPFSNDWGDFCQSVCQIYQIPLQILSVNASPKHRQSPEEAARDARYLALNDVIDSSDCLLTAHHQSDQVETVLLQLLRGSGPKGLAAMPKCREFYSSILVRPLLSFPRFKLKEYAHKQQLKWIDDESNHDENFKRNFLRHSIIPKLQQQWTNLETTLFRASQLQNETISILDEVAEQDLAICELRSELACEINPWFREPMLDRHKLKKLSAARIKNCIQFWLRKHKAAALTSILLKQVLDEFIIKQPTSKVKICWKYKQQLFQLRYYQGKLFLCQTIFSPANSLVWNYNKERQIHLGDAQIELESSQVDLTTQQLNLDKLADTILVKFREGGESYKKNQQSQHFSLKNWFQEQSIPPWIRSHIPLFYVDDQLIQIGNDIVNSYYLSEKNKRAVKISVSGQIFG